MAERKGLLGLILQVFLLLVILATLGIVIAILVTTLNIQTNQNNVASAPNNNNNNNQGNQAVVNIPPPQQPVQGQTQYTNYQSVVQLLKTGLNTQINPCDDFYKYTCGAYTKTTMMSFDVSDTDNTNKMAQQMMDPNYYNASGSKAVQQVIDYFNQCRNARANWNSLVADGAQVTNAINLMKAGDPNHGGAGALTQNIPFPMLDQTINVTTFPGATAMGYLLGYPTGVWGLATLVTAYVDTNWKDPQGTQGYAMFVDQPTTMLPYTYYVKAWDTYQKVLISNVIYTMTAYAATQNITLDQTKLLKDATDLVNFDYQLAMTFSTDETTRRQSARNYNPMTIKQMSTAYPNILWHEFIPNAMLPSADAMNVVLGNPKYNVIVSEPGKLQMLNDALVIGNQYGITPNVVLNYIYYNVVSGQADYLPSTNEHAEIKAILAKVPKMKSKRRRQGAGVIPERKRYERKQINDVDEAAYNCAQETMEMIQYANARVFIDKIYPTDDMRTNIRNNVAKVASSILIGFRSMIDQLDWMTSSTKKGAYSKIENLVKNIAYPDWITNNAQLDAYHATLGINSKDSYFVMANKANTFNMYQQWQSLAQGAADRIAFNGPPGTTNAWYQPELNSITFPAAILRQPFYDVNWPAAFNFGGMGVIAGHELTHGFDDEGVQWDGVGALNSWMDSTSQVSFNKMADCVVKEYSNFCPLNTTEYGTASCVDGAQTQGENIADNGGIHAAFRAYKNYINLNGPDPQLPDPTLQTFTADQLFFLAFAQVWCQFPPSDGALERQILVDPHSPSVYRVWGTIQNFPAFKDAFHCPASNYAPDSHCNVWVSDISSSYGLPPAPQANDLNIAVQPQAKPTNMDQYTAYQNSLGFFQYSTDLTADPCNDFWKYSCGNYQKEVSFHFADKANLVTMYQQLTNPAYADTVAKSGALTKEKWFFNACLAATYNDTTNNNLLIANNFLANKVGNLKNLLGADFTAIVGGTAAKPTPSQLGAALGYLSFTEGVDTYVTPMVDTYWTDNSKGYQFFIDQNTASMSKTYYQPNAWIKSTRAGYITRIAAVFGQYCTEQGLTTDGCSAAGRTASATRLADFEQVLAYNYSTDDATRRKYLRSWNLMTIPAVQTKYSFIDWNSYVAQMPAVGKNVVAAQGYNVAVMELDMTAKLNSDIQDATIFKTDDVVNYLYMRLLLGNAQYLPNYSAIMRETAVETDTVLLGKSRRGGKLPRRTISADATDPQADCISMANDLMQFANGRVFIDNLYPTNASRKAIRAQAGGLIKNVINSFQGMLEQLDWMDADTKTNALKKTNQVLDHTNIAYPDWITDNFQLDNYYDDLNLLANDDYYTMWNKLNQFNILLQYKQLAAPTTDRYDFLGQPGTVNAWYQPELDSITFPAGILRNPYFDPNWPASINYGGLGVVAGHELTHGFDDEGVQWGPDGSLDTTSWMDNNSSTGFTDMATCIVNEYSGFCPLDANQYSPNCVNGAQTQGENIADNGGIHAAFRAYRTHIALDGPDPLLPDRIFGQFTHDQLFFLSFGQVWCEKYRGDAGMYKQLMVDPHSPSQYRVFGTIQNYPAFQTAFNCPRNSTYAPATHCKVWVPTVEA